MDAHMMVYSVRVQVLVGFWTEHAITSGELGALIVLLARRTFPDDPELQPRDGGWSAAVMLTD